MPRKALVLSIVTMMCTALIILVLSGVSPAANPGDTSAYQPRKCEAEILEESLSPHELGKVLVRLRCGITDEKAKAILGAHACLDKPFEKFLSVVPWYVCNFDEGRTSIKEVLRGLFEDENVVTAEPSYLCYPTRVPNDTQVEGQWALNQRINGNQYYGGSSNFYGAWDVPAGDKAVTVAVIDSGLLQTHEDLVGRSVQGRNFLDNNADTSDEDGHGTFVSGIIAANTDNGVGIAGVAGLCPNVSLMPLKVGPNESGRYPTYLCCSAMEYAANHGAKIINMSFGTHSTDYQQSYQDAVTYAYTRDCILVAASGNKDSPTDPDGVEYPGACSGVIAVGSNDRDAGRSSFSDYGNGLDLLAPGAGILSTSYTGLYMMDDGTSAAAPQVAGLAAIMCSRCPGLTPAAVEYYLEKTAYKPPGYTMQEYGAGILDAQAVLSALVNPAGIPAIYQLYFPEGCTNGFEEWLCIQNTDTNLANVGIEYMTESGQTVNYQMQINGQSRYTVGVHNWIHDSVSARVWSDKKIFAERSMYWAGRREGHDCHGLKTPSQTWYLAEGCVGTSSGFQTFVLIQNPNDTSVPVNATFQTDQGKVAGPSFAMNPRSRYTIHVNDYFPNQTRDVSTVVHTDGSPILAERSMYWNIPSGGSAKDAHGGSCSLGAPEGNKQWFCAEGSTDYGFDTYVLIQNPTTKPALVNLTYMTPDGPRKPGPLTVPGNARYTVHVNDQVPNTASVSTEVESDVAVIAERALYWRSSPTVLGPGHSSEGAPRSATRWYLAEGSTAWGFETWVLVQNPNTKTANINVTYMTPGGPIEGPSCSLPPQTRMSINVADTPMASSTDVSTSVISSDMDIVVERSMYWGSRQGGTGSVGMCEDEYFNTPTGENVWVILPEGEVTFSRVNKRGTTVFVNSPEPPGGVPPLGYLTACGGQYYHLATTADYSGNVDVELGYSDVPSQVPASEIRLLYYNGSVGGGQLKACDITTQWSDITSGVDTQRKVVKGTARGTGIFCVAVPVRINFDPDTLNMRSEGRWVTTYITVPSGYDVSNIDVKTVKLSHDNHSVASAWGEKQEDGSLMIKFDRKAVASILPLGDKVQIVITGNYRGIPFMGDDHIRVISP